MPPGGGATRSTSISGATRGVTLPRRRPLPPLPPRLGSVPFSMPLGLIVGRPFSPFSRAISSRCAATIVFRSATSPSSSTTRASSSARGRPVGSEGGDMQRANRTRPRRGKLKNRRCPGFCPYYASAAKPLPTDELFAPATHENALDFNRPLLVGNRGAGKSVWSGVLADQSTRDAVAALYPHLGLD